MIVSRQLPFFATLAVEAPPTPPKMTGSISKCSFRSLSKIVRKMGWCCHQQPPSHSPSLFCRLFTSGPIRGGTSVGKSKSNPSPTWVSSSKEYFSSDSSMEKENSSVGLFSSFSERLDLPGQDKDKPGKKTIEARAGQKKPPKKKVVAAAKAVDITPVIGRKISDRGFSEDTLNYVASGLGAISLNELSNEAFTSPVIATASSPAMTKMAIPPILVEEEEETVEEEKFSPVAIGQAQATSTPANLVKVRLSVAESLQSPLNSGMATELIHRRGGKRWRRSSMAAALVNLAPEVNGGGASATPTSCRRRATIMVWYYVA